MVLQPLIHPELHHIIKTGRFSMIYADEVILSHTNENEYNSFVNNKKNEALKDRMILVKVTDLELEA